MMFGTPMMEVPGRRHLCQLPGFQEIIFLLSYIIIKCGLLEDWDHLLRFITMFGIHLMVMFGLALFLALLGHQDIPRRQIMTIKFGFWAEAVWGRGIITIFGMQKRFQQQLTIGTRNEYEISNFHSPVGGPIPNQIVFCFDFDSCAWRLGQRFMGFE